MAQKLVWCFVIFIFSSMIMYTIVPKKYRYLVLLFFSLGAYTVISKIGIVLLLSAVVTFYFAGIIMNNISEKYVTKGLPREERKLIKKKVKSKKRLVLTVGVIISLGMLLVLKYFNFISHSFCSLLNKCGAQCIAPTFMLILPLGISYYTLQGIGYMVDVCRNKYPAEKNFLKLALFICFFPQLNEGPFGRYDKLMPQLESGENVSCNSFYDGIIRFIFGCFKVFVVANRAAIIADAIFKQYAKYSGFTIAFASIVFTIQLYFEFSGYIDMASGVGEIFGVKLAKNFDKPFISKDVSEFWRRWHISLGQWFRDYIFYPVSTSKMSMKIMKKCKPAIGNFIVITFSLLVVWFLTGFWHGASSKYIVYGLYYFILMVVYNLLKPFFEYVWKKLNVNGDNKILNSIRIVKTNILVCIGMLMFRAPDLKAFKTMFISMFESGGAALDINKIIDIKDLVVLLIGFLFVLIISIFNNKFESIKIWYKQLTSYKKHWICFASFLIVMIFGAYGIGYIPPDPIYGGF